MRFLGVTVVAIAFHLATGPSNPAGAAEVHQARGVVELFTSQGCSSCPPADRLLGEISKSDDVLALGWHVDYWDYLGWKDTFGNPANTSRQRAYARSFGERQVYTPQAVINGRIHVVGSRRSAVLDSVEEFAGSSNGLTVPIKAVAADGMLKVNIPLTPQASGATLWMVYYNDRKDVDVKRGENRGKKLTYTNIVSDMEMIGMVKDQALQTEFHLADMQRRGYDSCALILQKTTDTGTPGPIVGAAFIRDIDKSN
ncbi:MAG: DUF1223 domain-containing protein [Salaquimonas sp.]|nr:DUF1223 domain-containing protein [Salaquimonas sp.]